MIYVPDNDWNPKGLVRTAVENYIQFNCYAMDKLTSSGCDCKVIAAKIDGLEKLLEIFDRRGEYEEAFSKEWSRSFHCRNLYAQQITTIEQELSCANLDEEQRAGRCFILEILRRDIRQSEDDEAKYGHPLVDMAKQGLSLISEIKGNDELAQPIPLYKMIMPIEIEGDELDLLIESIRFVFVPYNLFQWKSEITQLHEYTEEWLSSNSWKDANDLELLKESFDSYLSLANITR